MARSTAQQLDHGVGGLRFLFMPLGLLALVAVGVHAAADLVDDRLLALFEALDAWLDAVFARADWTRGWVDAVGSLQRVTSARGVALAWELAVDVLVALPLLGYRERTQPAFVSVSREQESAAQVLQRVVRAPTPMRTLRPLAVACFVGAGVVVVARLVEGSLFVGLAGLVPADWTTGAARAGAVGAALLVVFSLGARAVARSIQHGDRACVAAVGAGASPWTVGALGTALALPLALAVVLEAQAFVGVFR